MPATLSPALSWLHFHLGALGVLAVKLSSCIARLNPHSPYTGSTMPHANNQAVKKRKLLLTYEKVSHTLT